MRTKKIDTRWGGGGGPTVLGFKFIRLVIRYWVLVSKIEGGLKCIGFVGIDLDGSLIDENKGISQHDILSAFGGHSSF